MRVTIRTAKAKVEELEVSLLANAKVACLDIVMNITLPDSPEPLHDTCLGMEQGERIVLV